MIKLENLTYRYSDNLPPALLNISLEVAPGEAVCVMGANGSGKSTFAKLLAGLIKPQQGRLSLNVGKSVPIPVGLLFQNPDNQIVAVTVEKEIAFALENLGVNQSEMEKRVSLILREFSIEHLRQRLTSELSVGEKQRVALAALFVCRPPILVLDEPDSFLDREGKELFRSQLHSIMEQNPQLTVVEITQYREVAENYDRLIVFYKGRVVADGNSQQILQNRNLCIKSGIDFDGTAQKQIELPHKENGQNKKSAPVISRIMFDRVSFAYSGSEKSVLKNFSGEFNCGEITALTGPSGSGKSTVAMLMCNLLRPDAGEVVLFDQQEREISYKDARGQITASLQQPERQFFLHNCTQELEFGLRNYGRTISRKEIQSFFRMAGLPFEQFFERDPLTLSLGEKRRLAFAAILTMFPNFIVFDEPTCALDREGVGRFISLARGLKEAGKGIILISHDDEIVKLLADKIVALDGKGNFWTIPRENYLSQPPHDSNIIAK